MKSTRVSPNLISSSSCSLVLNFHPRAHWPIALPAVSIQGHLIAGFGRELCFDHQIPWDAGSEVAELFWSLHSSLSLIEILRLWSCARQLPSFPIDSLLAKYGMSVTETFKRISILTSSLPSQFQDWAAERSLNLGDFVPLLDPAFSNSNKLLEETCLRVAQKMMSKSEGVLALEHAASLSRSDSGRPSKAFEPSIH